MHLHVAVLRVLRQWQRHGNRTLLSAVRETARCQFEEKDLPFKSFAKHKLTELPRRVKAMESQEKRDTEGNIPFCKVMTWFLLQ